MTLENKAVLVAGGGSGIGRASAILFANRGARVLVADRDAAGAQQTVDMLSDVGRESHAFRFDITDQAECQAAVENTVERFGALDHVVSTVGWSDTTFFDQEDAEYWHRIVAINLLGSIYLSRAAIDHMQRREYGSIVLTSSDAGRVGTMGETVYAAAKAGVIGFVKSLAREVAKYQLRINAVSPGPTDTPLLRAQSDQDVIERMIRAVPLKRMGTPEEQAAAIVFLASDEASYITGQTLSVSGGLTMSS